LVAVVFMLLSAFNEISKKLQMEAIELSLNFVPGQLEAKFAYNPTCLDTSFGKISWFVIGAENL
jgi:hypothetical protein